MHAEDCHAVKQISHGIQCVVMLLSHFQIISSQGSSHKIDRKSHKLIYRRACSCTSKHLHTHRHLQ